MRRRWIFALSLVVTMAWQSFAEAGCRRPVATRLRQRVAQFIENHPVLDRVLPPYGSGWGIG